MTQVPNQICFHLIFALPYLFASSICEKRISSFKKTIKSDTKKHTRGLRRVMSQAPPISISFWPFIGPFHAKYVVVIYKKENISGAQDTSCLEPPPPALHHVAMSDGCNIGVVMVHGCASGRHRHHGTIVSVNIFDEQNNKKKRTWAQDATCLEPLFPSPAVSLLLPLLAPCLH